MRKTAHFQYYVEGDDETKLLSEFKTNMNLIIPGKIEKFNVVQEVLTKIRLMQLQGNTTVILVFDTDVGSPAILNKNITLLEKCSAVKQVVCIPQVENLEDELIRSCNIKQIKELLGSNSNKDFKHDLIIEKNLKDKLSHHNFDMDIFWSSQPNNCFKKVKNEAALIKK